MFESLQDGLSSRLQIASRQGQADRGEHARRAQAWSNRSLLEADVSFEVVTPLHGAASPSRPSAKRCSSRSTRRSSSSASSTRSWSDLMGPVDHSLAPEGQERRHGADDVRPAGLAARRPPAASSAMMLKASGASRCWWPPTCSARRPSTSCTCWASSSACRSTPTGRHRTRSRSARTRSRRPSSSGPTW